MPPGGDLYEGETVIAGLRRMIEMQTGIVTTPDDFGPAIGIAPGFVPLKTELSRWETAPNEVVIHEVDVSGRRARPQPGYPTLALLNPSREVPRYIRMNRIAQPQLVQAIITSVAAVRADRAAGQQVY